MDNQMSCGYKVVIIITFGLTLMRICGVTGLVMNIATGNLDEWKLISGIFEFTWLIIGVIAITLAVLKHVWGYKLIFALHSMQILTACSSIVIPISGGCIFLPVSLGVIGYLYLMGKSTSGVAY